VHTTLLTGDPTEAATQMAREAGMDDALAAVPPDRRARELTDSRREGVLAVGGDPCKDESLMQVGDVGIAVTEALSAQATTAGVWLIRGTFADLVPAIEVARHTRSVARQNTIVSVVWTALLMLAASVGILGAHGAFIAGGGAALLSSVLAVSTRRLLGRQPPVR
jgi:cation transport ATPase